MIKMEGGVARREDVRLAEPVDFELAKGECLALFGANGSGKNLLVDTLLGRYPLREGRVRYDFSPSRSDALYENVRTICFRDIYGSSEADYCYQLRWNIHEQDGIPTVREVLGASGVAWLDCETAALFGLDAMLDKLVVALSSGELRKLQIAKALADSPRLLVLDNPFIGLDAESRALLLSLLSDMAREGSVQLLLLLSSAGDVPDFVDSVAVVENRRVVCKMSRAEFDVFCHSADDTDNPILRLQERVLALPSSGQPAPTNEVVALNGVTVRYGNRTIINNLSWTVNCGDVWLLQGRNGSGKSTLLSLVCADNLQSYACDIRLFGVRRGSGESIWDIKRRIGYVSPEMHRSYLRNLPVEHIVASGLHDSIGLYCKSSPEQLAACLFWMDIFGIGHLRGRSFITLSGGEQRLVLLARTFVKNPDLLILDEPMHGLDDRNRRLAKAVIEAFSRRDGKTVVFVSHCDEDIPCTVNRRLCLK